MEIKTERRKFPRLDVNVGVKYKVLSDLEKNIFPDFGTLENEVHSKNISIDGICIKTKNFIEPGTILALEIHFSELTSHIYALGRIIWSKDTEGNGEFYSGVEFIAIKDRYFDQMSQLLAEYFVDKHKIKDAEDRKNLKNIFLQFFSRKK